MTQPIKEEMAKFIGDLWDGPYEGWDTYTPEHQKLILDGLQEFLDLPENERPEHPHYGNYVWYMHWKKRQEQLKPKYVSPPPEEFEPEIGMGWYLITPFLLFAGFIFSKFFR